MSNKQSLTIFFPFLNDWGTVGSLISLAIDTAKRYTSDYEVIIVNDGSHKDDRDALAKIVNAINFKHKNRVRIIDHETNRGYGGALISGFKEAKKDLIFYTDCDAQYDPRELSLLLQGLDKDVGMVNGFKIKRSDPWFRIIAGRVYHYLVKFAFQLPIRDTDCDFRLIRREIFDPSPPAGGSGRTGVRLYENSGTICVELVKKIDHFGYKINEVPVHHFWRTSGKSQFFNFHRLFKTGTNLFKLWWKLMVDKNYTK